MTPSSALSQEEALQMDSLWSCTCNALWSTRGLYSAPCSSSLCWRPCHMSSARRFPERNFIHMILSSLLTLEEYVRRLLIWKEAMEKEGLRVNARKTKVMICSTGLDLLQCSGKYPCIVCRTRVGNNSIYCNGCKLWVHKKCSGLRRLTRNPDYRCARYKGTARPFDSKPQGEVQVGLDKLEMVASFCYPW